MSLLCLSDIRDHLFLGLAAFVAGKRISQSCPVQPVVLPAAWINVLEMHSKNYFPKELVGNKVHLTNYRF